MDLLLRAALQCHLLLITGRSPGKVLISKCTGKLIQTEVMTAYDARFQLDRAHESVPFRMTRNLQAFVGCHGMDGLVTTSCVAAAQSLQHTYSPLHALVAIVLRYV